MALPPWFYATAPDSFMGFVNVVPGYGVKVLVPAEFGGGTIEGKYRGNAHVVDANGVAYDLYELLALWNSPTLRDMVTYTGTTNYTEQGRKACDNYGEYDSDSSVSDILRSITLSWLKQTQENTNGLPYSLKIARPKDSTTYEECKHISAYSPYPETSPVPVGVLCDYGADPEETWLHAVNPPVDRNRTTIPGEDLPLNAHELSKLKEALYERYPYPHQ